MQMEFNKRELIIGIGVGILLLVGIFYVRAMRQPDLAHIQSRSEIAGAEIETEEIEEVEQVEETEVEQEWIQVYVTGEVQNPGLYSLEKGKRVGDAVYAAGGLLKGADGDAINLAAYIADAQHIRIPSKGEEAEDLSFSGEEIEMIEIYEIEQYSRKIDINSATATELRRLPGIGEVLSKAIIDYREANGSFKNIHEIKNVPRIGDRLFESFRDLIEAK